jgi:hypothetical protein
MKIMLLIFGLLTGYVVGVHRANYIWEERAVDAGHAQRYVRENGESYWEWRWDCPPVNFKKTGG